MKSRFENLHRISANREYTRSSMRYVSEIQHKGLGTYRILKDLDNNILEKKVEVQFNKWDEQWSKIVEKNQSAADKEANFNLAEERTREAKEKLGDVEDILTDTLEVDDTVDWNTLKDHSKFRIGNPKNKLQSEINKIISPLPPHTKPMPREPKRIDFDPTFSFLDKVFKFLARKKVEEAQSRYDTEIQTWTRNVAEITTYNKTANDVHDSKLKELEDQKQQISNKFEGLEMQWRQQQKDFYLKQEEHNGKVEKLTDSYFKGDLEAVIEYCELVLNNSAYPDTFPKDFELDYNIDNKMLLVEYVLPGLDQFPTLTEVKYIATKKEMKESFLTEVQLAKLYDTAIYNITLRTLHELFEADQANAIEIVVFNGWVNAINKATGKRVNNCIVSIQVKKAEFLEIELANVDPKTCFKNLKGVGSSKLSAITAIQPIIQINKNDKRFVSSYDVADSLNAGDNLASMPWEDFEHLIREIFGKEFSSNGGEVKVTQASRDGGVDAIAFDPDPIRGGKIIIQAKRYANTVGVSAVRDLYGTVMNEGATKGILVTTADYGPDAYEFVKNKPLTLMNGANLLYLLEKHGHKARIDLAEAKKLAKQ